MEKIKIGIVGYGNLGKGAALAVAASEDMTLTGVYTRRDPSTVQVVTGAPAYHIDDLEKHADEIDVIILCGGSATDLPKQTPAIAKRFNVIDKFFCHIICCFVEPCSRNRFFVVCDLVDIINASRTHVRIVGYAVNNDHLAAVSFICCFDGCTAYHKRFVDIHTGCHMGSTSLYEMRKIL